MEGTVSVSDILLGHDRVNPSGIMSIQGKPYVILAAKENRMNQVSKS